MKIAELVKLVPKEAIERIMTECWESNNAISVKEIFLKIPKDVYLLLESNSISSFVCSTEAGEVKIVLVCDK